MDSSLSELNPDTRRMLDCMLMDFDERCKVVKRDLFLAGRVAEVFDRGIERVDRAKVVALQDFIRRNYTRLAPMTGFKYLDIPFYLAVKCRHVVELDLDGRVGGRILDLGTGGGHFPFLASSLGHEVVGVDMENEIYNHLLDVYSVKRIVQTISPGEKLLVTGKFALITALQTTFNRPTGKARRGRTSVFWTSEEWDWFMDELCRLLRYPGRIYFELNRQHNAETGEDHAVELMARFARDGAMVDRKRCTVLFELDGPWR